MVWFAPSTQVSLVPPLVTMGTLKVTLIYWWSAPTLSEVNEARKSKTIWSALGMWAEVISTRVMSEAQIKKWESNIGPLHDLVRL